MRVAVAVSGGMDSLLSLAILREQGHEVMAVHGLFLPDASEDSPAVQGLQFQCRELDVPLHVLDLRVPFRECVTDVFVEEYRQGRTPNPCALCNPRLKFGVLFDQAVALGAERLATGHYARIEGQNDEARLVRGVDPHKDQSYFLCLLSQAKLAKAIFPLGGLHKKDVPDELSRRGLTPPLSSESQEICFIPDDDYRRYLCESGRELPGPGAMLLADGTEVGRHKGLWGYTQGQRRGLGVSWSEPLYVVDKDVKRNALLLGPREELAVSRVSAEEMNVLIAPDQWPATVFAQTRYRQKAAPAIANVQDDRLEIVFTEPQDTPAPGQVLALYNEAGTVLAGGIIRS